MDSAPPSHRSNPHSQIKSASRLARISYSIIRSEERPSNLSLDLISSSPKKTPASPSTPSLRSSTNSLPLQELLILSPSPLRRSRTRLADKLEMAAAELAEPIGSGSGSGSRRRTKSRTDKKALLGCASPRNNRRPRRRMELESREERDLCLVEEAGKARKRRHSGKSKKEKLSIVPSMPPPTPSPKDEECDRSSLDRLGQLISDLVMWRDVAKSSLWFGLGCLCFLSSCFAKGVSFSIFSMISQLGLLFLGVSFISNSICQSRDNVGKRRQLKLREEDFQRVIRMLLPATNLAIFKMQELFSGEPSMTLKVAPFLLLGAEYGHLITLRRLSAFGFFISFTLPKLYSWYSSQINQKVEYVRRWIIEAWRSCSHKKIVAASAITAFWNLSTLKTRIFTAFISLVIIRFCRQHAVPQFGGEKAEEGKEEEKQDLVEAKEEEQQRALVLAGQKSQE